jgi:hypothetical protein
MNEITHKQIKSIYRYIIEQGNSLQYGKLSLCDLVNFYYSNVKRDRRYQVHCDDNKYPWSKIYDNLDSAIEKFLEIRKRIKRVK